MAVRGGSRIRRLQQGLAVGVFGVLIALFTIPPVRLSQLSATTLGGVVIGGGIWVTPALLSVVSLTQVRAAERSIASVVIVGLSFVTLGLTLLNVRTLVVTEEFLRYGGKGAFVGPLIALVTGCLLGGVVLLGEAVSSTSD
ncbi:hypothetical protein E6P09_00710 [Haloferax mediterranei ATCC 33500]|uniref:Uncharacterized protein n=1 Tax=Haloferax mediterranei (strain ATCC 33500 / DSM 1411 / JCM 8866 / NBRC 14739 / NCIMB 2177 / R-4) TaxID=523841 RepID=I3R6M5_HALMT|nr:hypothetical protein [Haloferax mediterranei]AFK19885.1 hypothetical protein HFX_2196 [Haloferax mediterranei ATCC 33500]AHZ23264.1 hypothetical protein BM92_11725 [Haloferax mediterranei ATCC 33500]ELZ99429.1 hypothetical protein C439_12784 [Haloferax mediterranei ATCC 33500]MDX5987366.1 hypothetical protein [Haloferax mediterranei ATCC 33500]QCQ73874.1 hypothetical protein E6P09_00710 [Haloferax mediterranei ATCC 33500]